MRGAPVAGKAKVAVTEEARQRNLADIGERIERRRIGLQRGQAALDLVGLVIGPLLDVMLRRPEAAFVHQKYLRVGHAIGQGLQPERSKARLGLLRDDLAAAGAVVEI